MLLFYWIDNMLNKPHIISPFLNSFYNFNNAGTFMLDPLYLLKGGSRYSEWFGRENLTFI